MSATWHHRYPVLLALLDELDLEDIAPSHGRNITIWYFTSRNWGAYSIYHKSKLVCYIVS